jgi:hypothetical protein
VNDKSFKLFNEFGFNSILTKDLLKWLVTADESKSLICHPHQMNIKHAELL